MDVLVVNRLRAGACLRRCCGFLTPVRSGICFRKAIRTTKLCTGARCMVVAQLSEVGVEEFPTKFCEAGTQVTLVCPDRIM
jgi:hypothetical protein